MLVTFNNSEKWCKFFFLFFFQKLLVNFTITEKWQIHIKCDILKYNFFVKHITVIICFIYKLEIKVI